MSGERRDHVNRVRARAVEGEVEADHAAGIRLGDGEIVVMRDGSESLRERGCLRGIAQRDVDVVRGELGWKRRASGDCSSGRIAISDLRPVIFCAAATISPVTARSSDFESDFLPQPARRQKQRGGKGRENPNRAARMQIYAASCGCQRRSWAAFFSTAAPPCKIRRLFHDRIVGRGTGNGRGLAEIGLR